MTSCEVVVHVARARVLKELESYKISSGSERMTMGVFSLCVIFFALRKGPPFIVQRWARTE